MQCPMMAKGAKAGQRCCAPDSKGKTQCGKSGMTCCSGNGGCCGNGKMACMRTPKGAKPGQGCCGMSCPMMQSGN